MTHPALVHVFAATPSAAHYIERVIQLENRLRVKTFCGKELNHFHLHYVYDFGSIAGAPPAGEAYRGADGQGERVQVPPSIDAALCSDCVVDARRRAALP